MANTIVARLTQTKHAAPEPFTMPRHKGAVIAAITALIIAGIIVLIVVLVVDRTRSRVDVKLPKLPKSVAVLPSRSNASIGVIVSNSPTSTYDSAGFGEKTTLLRGAVYTDTDITPNGKFMLQQLIDDPTVGCVYLQVMPLDQIGGWLSAAKLCLRNGIAVYALMGQQVGSNPVDGAAILNAIRVAGSLKATVGDVLAPYVGVALDIEDVGPTGWYDVKRALPPRYTGTIGDVPTVLFMKKSDALQPGAAEVVAAVNVVCLMFYRSMVKSNLSPSGVNSKFAADMWHVEGVVRAAAGANTSIVVGVETTWMGDFRKNAATKAAASGKKLSTEIDIQCDTIQELSFVLGGGMPRGTDPSTYFADPSTRAAYSVFPATTPTPTFQFVIQELVPWLQLKANMKAPPAHWPTGKSESTSTCREYGFGGKPTPSS